MALQNHQHSNNLIAMQQISNIKEAALTMNNPQHNVSTHEIINQLSPKLMNMNVSNNHKFFPFMSGLSSFSPSNPTQNQNQSQPFSQLPPIIANNNNNNPMVQTQKIINTINPINSSMSTNALFGTQHAAMSMSRSPQRRHHGLNQATPNSQFAPFQPLPPSLMPTQPQTQPHTQPRIPQQPQLIYTNTTTNASITDVTATDITITDTTPTPQPSNDDTVKNNVTIKRYQGEIKMDFNVTDFSADTKSEIKMDFNVTDFAANTKTEDTKFNNNNNPDPNNTAINTNIQQTPHTTMNVASLPPNDQNNNNGDLGNNNLFNLDVNELSFPSLPNFPGIMPSMFDDIDMDLDDDAFMNDDDLSTTINDNTTYHKCPHCPRTFQHKSNLTIHQKIHSSSAYICNFCGKKFARHSNLRQHTRVHTNERPFKCKHCPKSFKQQHSLVDHVRIHTGEKPHKCEFCEKAFAARCNLIVHRRIHS